eukprot:g28531.t1
MSSQSGMAEREAKEENTKSAWCETELASNKQTRETKTDAVDSLQAEIDQLKASIAKLGDETTTLSKEWSGRKPLKKATALRQKETEKNSLTIADAKEAQEAVAQALQVLKDRDVEIPSANLRTPYMYDAAQERWVWLYQDEDTKESVNYFYEKDGSEK